MPRLALVWVATALYGCAAVQTLPEGRTVGGRLSRLGCGGGIVLPRYDPYLLVPPAAAPGLLPAQWQIVYLPDPDRTRGTRLCVRSGSVDLAAWGPPTSSAAVAANAAAPSVELLRAAAGQTWSFLPPGLYPLHERVIPEGAHRLQLDAATLAPPAVPIPSPPQTPAEVRGGVTFQPNADGYLRAIVLGLEGSEGVLRFDASKVRVVAEGKPLGAEQWRARELDERSVLLELRRSVRSAIVRFTPSTASGEGPVVTANFVAAPREEVSEHAPLFHIRGLDVSGDERDADTWSARLTLAGPLAAVDRERTERDSNCWPVSPANRRDSAAARCAHPPDDNGRCRARAFLGAVDATGSAPLVVEITGLDRAWNDQRRREQEADACVLFRVADTHGRRLIHERFVVPWRDTAAQASAKGATRGVGANP